MQQMASWKYGLVTAVFGMLLVMSPAMAQQDASTSNSSAPATTGADAKSYTQFGQANANKGDMNGAIAAFNQALQIDPKYVPAYYSRGFVRAAQKDFDNALSDYNRAIQLDPTYLPAFYQRGTLKGMAGDFDAAVDDFNQVVKLDPKYAAAYYNIGHVDYFRGDFDGAVDQINKALAIQPDFFLGYFIRGLVRHAQGHLTEAQADFQKSASLNFTYATFWIWISQTEDGHRGIARQNLADALAKPEIFKAGDWASQIANFLLEKISQDDLIAAAGQGDPADGKNRLCEAWFYAGMVKHFAGDNKGALECYAKAVATDAKGSEEFAEASRRLTK